MFTNVSRSDFERAFMALRPVNFSGKGLYCLFDYLNELEGLNGEPMELDVIGVCCAYTEYASLGEFHEAYDIDDYPDLDAIRETTTLVELGDGGFIIVAF